MKYFTFGSVTDHVEPASNQVMAPVADKALIEQVVGGANGGVCRTPQPV
ncbi:hypothetical protein H8B13_19180 [Hymenobacter sp. BT188]|nr:hypothetical protein [Hymenobacter sp. BT188]